MADLALSQNPLDELMAALAALEWHGMPSRCRTCLVMRGEPHRDYCLTGRAITAAKAISAPRAVPAPAPARKPRAPKPETAPSSAEPKPQEPANRLRVLHSSASKEWGTPDWLFGLLHARHGFMRDVCASPENAKLPSFWSAEDNALAQEWSAEGGPYWMNPPYGTFEGACEDPAKCRKKSCERRGHHLEQSVYGIDAWMAKAREAALGGATVVCLVPARVDTHWWHDTVWAPAGQLLGVSMRSRHGERNGDQELKGCLQVITWSELRVEVLYVRSRLRFAGADGEPGDSAPFPSAIVTFRPPEFP